MGRRTQTGGAPAAHFAKTADQGGSALREQNHSAPLRRLRAAVGAGLCRLRVRAQFPGRSLPPQKLAPAPLLLAQRRDGDGPEICLAAQTQGWPLKTLRRAIDSLRNQTYCSWTLLLVAEDAQEARRLRKAAGKERRIRVWQGQLRPALAQMAQTAPACWLGVLSEGEYLHPCALWYAARQMRGGVQMVYTDEETGPEGAKQRRYKPDFAPDTLRSMPYIGGLCLFSAALYQKTGGGFTCAYDAMLRLSECAEKIAHVPHVLFFSEGKHADTALQQRALEAHLARAGLRGTVRPLEKERFRISYALNGAPRVAVIIPNRDQPEVLERCVRSIQKKSTYQNYEILIAENNSAQPQTFALYQALRREGVRVETFPSGEPFNYARINNWAVRRTEAPVLLFLNNDVEVITPGWIEELLMFAQRPDVGAAGALLWYPDDTVQHAGVVVGAAGAASHIHKFAKRGEDGWLGCLHCARNVSAVTGACLMTRREAFEAAGGFDESFAVAFNDIDLCLRLCGAGLRNVFTPFAQLYHHESLSRGSDETPENRARFAAEVERFCARWHMYFDTCDPYYSPRLNRADERVFEVREELELIKTDP